VKSTDLREYAIRRRLQHRDYLAKIKSESGCIRCHEADHRCLLFHHRDPSTKKFQVSQSSWSRTLASLIEEIAKCDIICANCHHKEHYIRYDIASS
jgi:hypothetical protein